MDETTKFCPLRGGMVVQQGKLNGQQQLGRVDAPCAEKLCKWWSEADKDCVVTALHGWYKRKALKSLIDNT